ncbi:MAG: acyl-CoA desaturase [Aeoliella sp.]
MSTPTTEEPLAAQPDQSGVAHSGPRPALAETSEPADRHLSREPVKRPIARPPMVDNQSRLVWSYIVGVGLFHLLIPLAVLPYVFSWWGLLWLPVGNYLFCSLGIGAGYHRLHTHRGYKCPLWFERFLAVLGILNVQESPARWVLVHRLHHQHSDHEPDPHTPMVSWFWGHVGWLFIENRATTNIAAYEKYARDMVRDPFYLALERNNLYWLINLAQLAVFYLLGMAVGFGMTGTLSGSTQVGVQWLLWGAVYRIVYTWHVTWAVNSLAHMYGYRNYDTRENSQNNWLAAILTNGEGWHNNHHADPRSAAQGHRWWEIDITFRTICLWERIGLVWDVVRPNESLRKQRRRPR